MVTSAILRVPGVGVAEDGIADRPSPHVGPDLDDLAHPLVAGIERIASRRWTRAGTCGRQSSRHRRPRWPRAARPARDWAVAMRSTRRSRRPCRRAARIGGGLTRYSCRNLSKGMHRFGESRIEGVVDSRKPVESLLCLGIGPTARVGLERHLDADRAEAEHGRPDSPARVEDLERLPGGIRGGLQPIRMSRAATADAPSRRAGAHGRDPPEGVLCGQGDAVEHRPSELGRESSRA